jgi:gamma-glutamyl-gamma-aminobutyrate hydrolase PuuD
VQWHPERIVDKCPEQRHLFEKFVNAARHYGEAAG